MKRQSWWLPILLVVLVVDTLIAQSWYDREVAKQGKSTWICLSLDGEHSALAIEHGGEGSVRSSNTEGFHEVVVYVCTKDEAMTWTKKP